MRAKSFPANPFRIAMREIQSLRFPPVQSELVFVPSRGNVRMAAGLYVRVYADGCCRFCAFFNDSRGLFVQDLQFSFGFHVEKQNSRRALRGSSIVQRLANLLTAL